MKFLQRVVLHPLLFAGTPVLAVFAHNSSVLEIGDLVFPLLIAFIVTGLMLLLARLAVSDWQKAGMVASSFVGALFLAGHLLNLVKGSTDVTLMIGFEITALLSCFLIACSVLWYVRFKTSSLSFQTAVLNVTAICFAALPTINIALSYWHGEIFVSAGGQGLQYKSATERQVDNNSAEFPDIYYLILDGYGRNDVLKDIFHYDNQPFLDKLRSRGFFIASKARSNYCQTYLSLASSLSMNYLRIKYAPDSSGKPTPSATQIRHMLVKLIRENAVMRVLKDKGYTTVSFQSGYSGTDISSAQVHIAPPGSLDEFSATLLDLVPLGDQAAALFADDSPLGLHRQRVLFILRNFGNPPMDKRPLFVFAHVVAPHPPFVFDDDGEIPVQWTSSPFFFADGIDKHGMNPSLQRLYVKQYITQMKFVNDLVISTVDEILARSGNSSIIVIQGDHGPGLRLDWYNATNTDFKERMSILSAYRLPKSFANDLNDRMTPVNTFRLIFKNLFKMDIKPLPDRSFFSTWETPMEFIEVPDGP